MQDMQEKDILSSWYQELAIAKQTQNTDPLFTWIDHNDLTAIKLNLAKYKIKDWFSENDLYDKKNSDEFTPIQLACQLNRSDILHFFYQFMCDSILPKDDDIELYRANKLCMAAYCGLLQEVKKLWPQYPGPTYTTDRGRTPVYRAALNGHLEVIKFLHAQGVDLNRANDDGVSPLHTAAQKGYLNVVEFLVINGAAINCLDKVGESPLFRATGHNHYEVANYLLDNKADVNVRRKDTVCPLHGAVARNALNMVKLLLFHGGDVNLRVSNMTPLGLATLAENIEMVKVLASDPNIKINATWDGKETALQLACQKGLIDIVEILLQNSQINVNLNCNGATALTLAVKNNHIAIVQALLEKNADANERDAQANLPIIYAVTNKSLRITKMLLQKMDIDSLQTMSEILVTIAIVHHDVEMLKLLLDKKLDVNKNVTPEAVKRIKLVVGQICITNPMSPLHIAVLGGYENVVRVLIESPLTNIDFGNSLNSSALIEAAYNGHHRIVKLLLEHGADIHHRNYEGVNALYSAAQEGHVEVLKLLLQFNAAVDSETNSGHSPLFTAILKKRFAVVKLLLEHGADVNYFKTGWTPLHMAIAIADLRIVKLLLENGGDMKIVNTDGVDALEKAHAESPVIARFLRLWAIKEANKNAPLQQQILALLQKDNVNIPQTKTSLPFFSSTSQECLSALCQKLTNMNLTDEQELRQEIKNNAVHIQSEVYTFIMEYILPKLSQEKDCDNSEVDSKRQKLL